MAEQLKSICSIDPKRIVVGQRLRPASPAGVEAVKSSILALGAMKYGIHIRKKKDGHFHLIAGLHRLTAVLELEWDEIPVVAWKCTNDWARMMEIDDNLAGAELTPLDTAIFLAARKAVYEKMYPETKAGVAGGLARQGLATDMMSFAEASAEKFGLSRRHIERLIKAGAALSSDQIGWLRDAPKLVTLADLQTLSKVADDSDRSKICISLSNGDAKSAADAIKRYKDPVASIKDPVEEAFRSLRDAWSRAPKEARKRFLKAEFKDIHAMQVAGYLK
ncbi:MAG: ParB N-terminal domain-containing protein [Pseudomonadota bacterium]